MIPSPPRALIVEDDRSWQQILSEILTDAGLAVDVTDSLEGAIDSLRASPHRLAVVDLALGDGDYQNQDGLRVLDAVRRQDPGCVAILLTGFATVELAVNALSEHGAYTCLRKESFSRTQFRDLVRQALASAPPMDATLHDADAGTPHDRPVDTADTSAAESPSPDPILVVEDDASWRSILAEMLDDAGYQARLCGSFGEALGCLRRERYSLAVVDLSLSGFVASFRGRRWARDERTENLDGYQLLASAQTEGVPTIVVSGVAASEDIERTYQEYGVFAFLEKQAFNRQAFLQTVGEACATAAAKDELNLLTEREREVLELIAQGLTNKEIAKALVITANTVKRHVKAIFSKLQVHTRSAAAAKAINAGIPVEPTDEDTHRG